MLYVVVVVAAICLALAVAVLWGNPYRFTNQVYAFAVLLVMVWLLCVAKALATGFLPEAGFAGKALWLRLNTMVTGFIPWAVWLLKESLVTAEINRRRTLLRSLPWLGLGVALCALCCADSFVEATDSYYRRGTPYRIYSGLGILACTILVVQSYRQLKHETGIRRIEMKFFTLNGGLVGLLAFTLLGIGNVFGVPMLGSSTVFLILGWCITTAWAIFFYRIFDARQIFLAIGQRTAVLVFLGLGIMVFSRLLSEKLPAPAAFLLSAGVLTPAVVWLDRKSRTWLRIADEQKLLSLRSTVLTLARTQPRPEGLVVAFEELLRRRYDTKRALLVAEPEHKSAGGPRLRISQRSYTALSELGWVTPESLQRRRATPEFAEWQRVLKTNELGVIVTIPGASATPSLVLALGTKPNEVPFTYPEVRQLQQIGELIDHVLTRSRLTAQAALEAKMEHLAMMSRGMAHDLKNLITPVSSFLVHTDGHFLRDTVAHEVHTAAKRSVKTMTDYVSEALFFAKRLELKIESVNLTKLIETVRDVTQPRAREHDIAVVLLTDNSVISADGVLLQRALVNLVHNAIDASPRGQQVEISANTNPTGVTQLRIADHGCGISPENIARVLEPYFTTKDFGESRRGFGLGLTICQKIAHLHAGTISIQSELGRGTIVLIELPSTTTAAKARPLAELEMKASVARRPADPTPGEFAQPG